MCLEQSTTKVSGKRPTYARGSTEKNLSCQYFVM